MHICWQGLKYVDCKIALKGCVLGMMRNIWWWGSCSGALKTVQSTHSCYYSQVHSELERVVIGGSIYESKTFILKLLLFDKNTWNLRPGIIIIIIIYSFRVFHISVSWYFFTGVWVTTSFLKSPGLVSGFWPFSAILSFG